MKSSLTKLAPVLQTTLVFTAFVFPVLGTEYARAPGPGWQVCSQPPLPGTIPPSVQVHCGGTGGNATDSAATACTKAQSDCTNHQTMGRGQVSMDTFTTECKNAGGTPVSGPFNFSNNGDCNATNPNGLVVNTDQECKFGPYAANPCWITGVRSVSCFCPPTQQPNSNGTGLDVRME